MRQDNAISFTGKGGDVSSVNEMLRETAETINHPPAEAFIAKNRDSLKSAGEFAVSKELMILLKAMIRSAKSRKLFLLTGAAIFALILIVVGELRMNIWQGAFFRAIEHKNLAEVGKQAALFVSVMLVMLAFVVTHNWLMERLKIRLREWLTETLMDDWMKSGRAYRLNMTSEERLQPDQRIQEDVKQFSEMSGDLGIGVTRATLMLISFVGVLWVMSRGISLSAFGHTVIVPGYMVWCAIAYAALGSYLAARVGRPLIDLNEERYSREANYRYSLVRISENAESISLYGGEKDERRFADRRFDKIVDTLKKLSFANARLTWIASGHGWLVVIMPVLAALPGYLQGKLDFGGLMMVVGAFNQVQLSLRWFVENFARIADWRASLHRVTVFRRMLATVDSYENVPQTIELLSHPQGHLEFDATSITLMDGKMVIDDATAVIHPGERVLLVGESGSGKSTLLRAVSGLWPWGSGKIYLPSKDDMMFLPQKPYIPLGTLGSAIAYPFSDKDWDRDRMQQCLERVNLEAFTHKLDERARWDKILSLGQQQRLAFARLLYHKPKWVFLDEATSALDDENQHRLMSLFLAELKDSALLSVGHRQGLEEYHTRTLHLLQTPSGRMLSRVPVMAGSNSIKDKFFQKNPKPVGLLQRFAPQSDSASCEQIQIVPS